jgi:hypothetical protein
MIAISPNDDVDHAGHEQCAPTEYNESELVPAHAPFNRT